MAAPTISLPYLSLEALGKVVDFCISLKVTMPRNSCFLLIINIFSILFFRSAAITSSLVNFSYTVTSFSFGVIILETFKLRLSTNLRSLFVTIPTKILSSTIGTPDI